MVVGEEMEKELADGRRAGEHSIGTADDGKLDQVE